MFSKTLIQTISTTILCAIFAGHAFPSEQTLTSMDKKTICTGVMSMLFYYPARTIKADSMKGNIVQVLLPPKEGGTTNSQARCKIAGDRVIWAINGKPWSYQTENAIMTFSTSDKDITLMKTYADGFRSTVLLPRR